MSVGLYEQAKKQAAALERIASALERILAQMEKAK